MNSLFYSLVALHPYLQMTESGTTSASHGRIQLDHGSCSKMERLRLLVKVLKQVELSTQ